MSTLLPPLRGTALALLLSTAALVGLWRRPLSGLGRRRLRRPAAPAVGLVTSVTSARVGDPVRLSAAASDDYAVPISVIRRALVPKSLLSKAST